MDRTVGEVSKLTGTTKRALQHYDGIGLLCPMRTASGYRLYTDDDLLSLFIIRIFVDLGYSLERIAEIMKSDDYEVANSLELQIRQLQGKKREIEYQISFATRIKELIEEPSTSTPGEIIASMLRHPEYAWLVSVFDDGSNTDVGSSGKDLQEYLQWFRSSCESIGNSTPENVAENFEKIITESQDINPLIKPFAMLSAKLSELCREGIQPESSQVQSLVRGAYNQLRVLSEDDPVPSLYIVGKYMGSEVLTPPILTTALNDEEAADFKHEQEYIAQAVRHFIDAMVLTDEQEEAIAELDFRPED